MIEQTYEEWREEAIRRFGKDPASWSFQCPACGKVSSIQDFRDLGVDDNAATQQCIGRVNGKGMTSASGDNHDGCDWAAFGLLGTMGKGRRITFPNGSTTEAFDFPKEERECH